MASTPTSPTRQPALAARPRSIVRVALMLLALAGAASVAAEPQPTAIVGHYDLAGVNRDGSTYGGSLEITELGGNLYWLDWQDSDSRYTGRGALVGRTLYAVWGSEDALCFVAFLARGDGGVLEGDWFRANEKSAEAGTLTATPKDGGGTIDGTYQVDSSGPGGGLPARLEITGLGDGYYRFRWEGATALEGIGVTKGGDAQIQVVSSLAGHQGQCGKSEISIAADGSLSGTWMMNGGDYRQHGRETATPRR